MKGWGERRERDAMDSIAEGSSFKGRNGYRPKQNGELSYVTRRFIEKVEILHYWIWYGEQVGILKKDLCSFLFGSSLSLSLSLWKVERYGKRGGKEMGVLYSKFFVG